MWITVATFPLSVNLQNLVNYLKSEKVAHRVAEVDGKQVLQVTSELQKLQAINCIERWQGPEFETVTTSARPRVSISSEFSKIALMRTPVTVLLIILSFVGYLIYEIVILRQYLSFITFYNIALLDNAYTLLSQDVPLNAAWRLITPAFLHLGIFHVVFNCLWVWDFGRRIEISLGLNTYILFFIVSATASNITQHFWSLSPSLFGGMSGVVYAMVGYIAVCQKFDSDSSLNVPMSIVMFMIGWMLLCLFGIVDLFMEGGIANGAHVGGLIAGIVFAFLVLGVKKINRRVL